MKGVRRASEDFLNSIWSRVLKSIHLHPLLTFLSFVIGVLAIASAVLSTYEADQAPPLWRSLVYMLSGIDVDPPQTTIGEVTALAVLICGVIIVSLLTGFVAAEFSKLLSGINAVTLKSPRAIFEQHIVIFGWNAKTKAILRELDADFVQRGYRADDIVIVSEQERLERGQESIYDHVWHVRGSSTDPDVLRKADIPSSEHGSGAQVAVILGNSSLPADEVDRHSLLTLLAVEHLHPPVISLADLTQEESTPHFLNANADEVLVPAAYASLLLARAAEYPGLASYVDELLALAPDTAIAGARTPVSLFVVSARKLGVAGKPLTDAVVDVYCQRQDLIAGILGPHDATLFSDLPHPQRLLEEDDQLVVITRPAGAAA